MSFGILARLRKLGCSSAALAAQIAAIVCVPMVLQAFPEAPPTGRSGAPGEGTCASCHSGTANPSGSVSITFPGGLTYTPGVQQQLQVTVSESGQSRWGFEAAVRTSSNAQAGDFAPLDGNTQVLTAGGFQYIAQTLAGTHAGTLNTNSWSFTWTPPATDVGNITFFVAGLAANNNGSSNGDDTFIASFTLAPASPPTLPTLTVSPAMLTFNSANGAVPGAQTFHVASSGTAINFTTSVSTTSGGSWLSAVPAGGATPLDVTVSVNPAGLAAATYTGAVSVTSSGASNSPQSVGVTLTVTGAPPPTNPTLSVSPSSLTFNSSTGGAQNVQVTSSGSALSFNTAVSTTSGGNWLSVNPASGTTPATVAVSAAASGLAPGTYMGSVVFTAAGAANGPQTLNVTLIVAAPLPPPTNAGPLQFRFHVLDRQSGGTDRMLLSGRGAIDENGGITGSGRFVRFTATSRGEDEDDRMHIVSMGAWKATGVTSFTPATADPTERSGGILEITVDIIPQGGSTSPGTMRIANTGAESGVTLTVSGGPTFVPTGAGSVKIRSTAARGGEEDEDDDDDEGGDGDDGN